MKLFTQLFQEIDSSTKTNDKVAAMVNYFQQANDKDKIWTIALLIGNKPKRPVKTTQLREWAAEITQIPLWLIEESYYVVGDLSETLAHIIPDNEGEEEDLSLSKIIVDLKNIIKENDDVKKEYITTFWRSHNYIQNFVFNKLITGNFRMGVSKQLVIKALAIHLSIDEKVVAHRMMGKWNPEHETMEMLFLNEINEDKNFLPYPFFLAYPLEKSLAELGNLEEWLLEKKYDGIRGQIIVRNDSLFVWSRGEDLMTEKFPEFEPLKSILPNGTVLDGEIIPWKDGKPLSFSIMQTRIGRKNLTAKILKDAPIKMICFDILEENGMDIRHEPLEERRKKLVQLLSQVDTNETLLIAPSLDFDNWDEVMEFRKNARSEDCEGVMIKRRDSEYEVGRKRGNWWKYKSDPMTIDGVLLYAQSGSGRRANLFTDYTFAVWNNEELVPFAKAYSGLTDKEILQLDNWIKRNTIEKFGPVRSVKPEMVFEIAFEGINKSTRHKSGVAIRFPRIARWRTDKKIEDANHLSDLWAMINEYE